MLLGPRVFRVVLEVELLVAAWVFLSVVVLMAIPALCLPLPAADVGMTFHFVVCGFVPYVFEVPGWIGTCGLISHCEVCGGFIRVGCPQTGLVAGGSHRGQASA